MLINVLTQARIEPYELRSFYPNTSFPVDPTDAALEGFDFKVLNEGVQPEVTSTQKAIDTGSELREDGKWYIVWAVVDKTAEELYAENPRVFEIQMRLPSIDGETLPLLRAVVTGKATPEQTQALADLEDEFQSLTAEFKALQPPVQVPGDM